jgi:serine/threonine-protein kinase RsbW
VDAAEASSVDLCATEAVTNAIKHAYRGAQGHDVSVEVCFTSEPDPDVRLDVSVCDQGVSMPEEQLAKLRDGSNVLEFDPADLGSVPEGGMGIEIIRLLMDQVSYSTNGGTNCLRMTKFFGRSESAKVPA